MSHTPAPPPSPAPSGFNPAWMIGCAVVGVLVVVLCGGIGVTAFMGIMGVTQPVVDASEEFLGLVGQGKTSEAYSSTASGFRALMDEASFTEAVEKLGMTQFASASWFNRQINNQNGTVEGTATKRGGGPTPVTIRLVFEEGAWRVAHITWGGVDLDSLRPVGQVPAAAVLRKMVNEVLLDFNAAVQAKDFTAFYEKTSDTWKQQITAEEIQAAFQAFIDQNVDIGPIRDVTPQIASATIDDEGALVITGHYPTQPAQVHFALRYVDEDEGWKLLAINVNVRPG
jgi:hypothetical protein